MKYAKENLRKGRRKELEENSCYDKMSEKLALLGAYNFITLATLSSGLQKILG